MLILKALNKKDGFVVQVIHNAPDNNSINLYGTLCSGSSITKEYKKYKETLSPDYKQSVDDEVVENFHFYLFCISCIIPVLYMLDLTNPAAVFHVSFDGSPRTASIPSVIFVILSMIIINALIYRLSREGKCKRTV